MGSKQQDPDPRPLSCPLSLERYRALREALLEQAGQIYPVAKRVKLSRTLVRTAWETGWRGPQYAQQPIRVLWEEKRLRAGDAPPEPSPFVPRHDRETAPAIPDMTPPPARVAKPIDVEKERDKEARLVEANLSAVLTQAAVVARLQPSIQRLAEHLGQQIEQAMRSQGGVGVREGLAWLERYGKAIAGLSANVGAAQEALRVHVGLPKDTIAIALAGTIQHEAVRADPDAIVDHLGEETLREAFRAIGEGKTSPELAKLIEFEVGRRAG